MRKFGERSQVVLGDGQSERHPKGETGRGGEFLPCPSFPLRLEEHVRDGTYRSGLSDDDLSARS